MVYHETHLKKRLINFNEESTPLLWIFLGWRGIICHGRKRMFENIGIFTHGAGDKETDGIEEPTRANVGRRQMTKNRKIELAKMQRNRRIEVPKMQWERNAEDDR